MSSSQSSGLRLNALAAATAAILVSVLPVAHAAERLNLSGLANGDLHSRFIVKYKDGSAERATPAAAANALRSVGAGLAGVRGTGTGVRHLRRMAVGADVVESSGKLDRVAAEALMRQIAANPNVEYVEVDGIAKALYTPNDPSFSQQYGYGTGAGGIRATEAWDKATGEGAVVAVLDTGVTSHSDLSANLLPGYDFIGNYTTAGGTTMGNDGDGRDSDPSDPGDWLTTGECGTDSNGLPIPRYSSGSSWHGSHVTGTIAAVTNNGKGVAGTAFKAKVVPVRVLGKCGGYESDIADAIVWASGGSVPGVPANANPAEVINLSLGGRGGCSATYQNAINSAVGRGSTVVIAAGNDSVDVSLARPANCNNIVSVASNDSAGARSDFSNYGSLIDVSAPGSSILSTINNGSTRPTTEAYASYDGTSMAAPHVAGVVALMQSVASTPKTPAEIESLLKSTARAFPSTPSRPIGAGIVNAKAAVDAVSGGGGGTPTPTPGTLQNGTPITGVSGAAGSEQRWTIVVPSGASNLVIKTSGGTGDADLYVRYGSAPTSSTYDCRPYQGGNNETCTIAAPQAGTYHVMVKGYAAFSGLTLSGSYSSGGSSGGGAQTYTNGTDVAIPDNSTVTSTIAVSGRTGNGSATTPVAVNIAHTYIGDLKVDLVAPDGSVYVLHNNTGTSTDNINKTYTVNLSSEALNGSWRLRVSDIAAGDTGKIDTWSITF